MKIFLKISLTGLALCLLSPAFNYSHAKSIPEEVMALRQDVDLLKKSMADTKKQLYQVKKISGCYNRDGRWFANGMSAGNLQCVQAKWTKPQRVKAVQPLSFKRPKPLKAK